MPTPSPHLLQVDPPPSESLQYVREGRGLSRPRSNPHPSLLQPTRKPAAMLKTVCIPSLDSPPDAGVLYAGCDTS